MKKPPRAAANRNSAVRSAARTSSSSWVKVLDVLMIKACGVSALPPTACRQQQDMQMWFSWSLGSGASCAIGLSA